MTTKELIQREIMSTATEQSAEVLARRLFRVLNLLAKADTALEFYEEKEFDDPLEYWGFVYLIEGLDNNKKYIGKKFFYSSKTKQVK